MLLRTLSLLRSLQGAHHTTQDARARIQQACDYRWLASQLPHGVIVPRATRLDDGTPAVPVMVPFVATPERRRGGRWPADPEARERCYVEGGHACRAAGAPGYRTLESLSQGLVQGGMAVLKDAARFQYLEEREALRLTWRRLASLPADLAGGSAAALPRPTASVTASSCSSSGCPPPPATSGSRATGWIAAWIATGASCLHRPTEPTAGSAASPRRLPGQLGGQVLGDLLGESRRPAM